MSTQPRPVSPAASSRYHALVRDVPISRCATVAAAAPSQRELVSLSLLHGPEWHPGATHRRASAA